MGRESLWLFVWGLFLARNHDPGTGDHKVPLSLSHLMMIGPRSFHPRAITRAYTGRLLSRGAVTRRGGSGYLVHAISVSLRKDASGMAPAPSVTTEQVEQPGAQLGAVGET